MRCPSLNRLFDYVRSQLSADEHTAVQKHLSAGCRSCQENQRWLQEAIQLAAQDQSSTLPEELIREVVARLNRQSATPLSSFRQLFAQLIFDSFIPGPL